MEQVSLTAATSAVKDTRSIFTILISIPSCILLMTAPPISGYLPETNVRSARF